MGRAYDLGGPEVLTFGDATRMLYRAEREPVRVLSVPMHLAKVGLYAVDPIASIPLGIDQARTLEMSNVTEHNDVDAFGLEESDRLTLSTYLART